MKFPPNPKNGEKFIIDEGGLQQVYRFHSANGWTLLEEHGMNEVVKAKVEQEVAATKGK